MGSTYIFVKLDLFVLQTWMFVSLPPSPKHLKEESLTGGEEEGRKELNTGIYNVKS